MTFTALTDLVGWKIEFVRQDEHGRLFLDVKKGNTRRTIRVEAPTGPFAEVRIVEIVRNRKRVVQYTESVGSDLK